MDRPGASALLYEVSGAILGCVGVVLFGFGLFPSINPIQWRHNIGDAYLIASRVSLVASVAAMSIGWWLSRTTQRRRNSPMQNP
jgi:hypothetical protein